jgi:hypothetical protein
MLLRTVLFPERYVLSNICVGIRHLSISIQVQRHPFALHTSFFYYVQLSTYISISYTLCTSVYKFHHFLLSSLHLASQSRQIASISLGLDSRPSDTRSKFWFCLLYVSIFEGPSWTVSSACSVSFGGVFVSVTPFLHRIIC